MCWCCMGWAPKLVIFLSRILVGWTNTFVSGLTSQMGWGGGAGRDGKSENYVKCLFMSTFTRKRVWCGGGSSFDRARQRRRELVMILMNTLQSILPRNFISTV